MDIKNFFKKLKDNHQKAKREKNIEKTVDDHFSYKDSPAEKETKEIQQKSNGNTVNKDMEQFTNKQASNLPSKGELEKITNTLISETEYLLRKKFRTEIESELKKGSQIEEDYAIKTINNLIYFALAQRHMLIGRIEKDVETGMLFDRYFGKLETVNNLTNRGYVAYKEMLRAKEEWEYEEALYLKMKSKYSAPDSVPTEVEFDKIKDNEISSEAWTAMDSYEFRGEDET